MSEPLTCYAVLDVALPAYSMTGGRVLGLFWRRDDAEAHADKVRGRGDGPDLRVVPIEAPPWMPVAFLDA